MAPAADPGCAHPPAGLRDAQGDESNPLDAGAAKTLRELGIPPDLASGLEATLRAMGAVDGLDVVGFTFLTPDGARHRLRVEGGTPDG